jgi:hypothetical protein
MSRMRSIFAVVALAVLVLAGFSAAANEVGGEPKTVRFSK